MPPLLSSPRVRRRLAWTLGPLLVAGGIVGAVLLAVPAPKPFDNALSGTVAITPTPKAVPVTGGERRAIDSVLTTFVVDAVRRANPAAAWSLATPALRGGSSRGQWAHGSLPVQQFPAGDRNVANAWITQYSYPGEVGIELFLKPDARHSAMNTIAYAVDLRQLHGRWLVDSFYPQAFFASTHARSGPRVVGPMDFAAPGSRSAPISDKATLSVMWLVIPAVLAGLVIGIPLALILLTRWRQRREDASYREGGQTLPPLPNRGDAAGQRRG